MQIFKYGRAVYYCEVTSIDATIFQDFKSPNVRTNNFLMENKSHKNSYAV